MRRGATFSHPTIAVQAGGERPPPLPACGRGSRRRTRALACRSKLSCRSASCRWASIRCAATRRSLKKPPGSPAGHLTSHWKNGNQLETWGQAFFLRRFRKKTFKKNCQNASKIFQKTTKKRLKNRSGKIFEFRAKRVAKSRQNKPLQEKKKGFCFVSGIVGT